MKNIEAITSNSKKHPVGEKTNRNFLYKITILCAFFLPLLLSLSYWQFGRYHDKKIIEEQDFNQQQLPTIEAYANSLSQLQDFRSIFIEGEYLLDKNYLLINKTRSTVAGVEVIKIFKDKNNQLLAVNIGFLPLHELSKKLILIDSYLTSTTLYGQVRSFKPETSYRQKFSTANELAYLQKKLLENLCRCQIANKVLYLSASNLLVFDTHFNASNLSSDKHLGYAIQWLLMAVVLIAWFFWVYLTHSSKRV